jgi:hypothetical protein
VVQYRRLRPQALHEACISRKAGSKATGTRRDRSTMSRCLAIASLIWSRLLNADNWDVFDLIRQTLHYSSLISQSTTEENKRALPSSPLRFTFIRYTQDDSEIELIIRVLDGGDSSRVLPTQPYGGQLISLVERA